MVSATTATTTPGWRRRRRLARTSVLARCFFFLATMAMTTTTKKAAVRVGLVAGETTITWTPGAPSATTAERGSGSVKETAATAPRSQRYWDEHGIERPDYAKTDAEIAVERLRSWFARFELDDRDPRTRDGGRSRTDSKTKTSRKWGGRLFAAAAAAALWGLLALGRQTESMHGSDLRAMWDETRKSSSSCSRDDLRRRRFALVRAVLYESQPVRLSTLSRAARRIREQLTSADNHRALREMVERIARVVVSAVRRVLRTWTLREYKSFVLYPLLYCCFVRFVHAKLDAGPIAVIATSLYLILTAGLDDSDGDNGGVSAYSVFNRGFRRLLGDVDAEELVAQHVGGGGGVGAAMAAAARQRREEAQQEQQEEERRREIERRPLARDGDDDHDDLAPPPTPAARRSGKRARRRNLEERRERRRQRQAAIDMGLVGDELGDAEMIRIMENDGRADAD